LRGDPERLSRALGHDFRDPGLLETALTHRSAGGANNERLEFLGDAILGFVVAEELYLRFGSMDEGHLSRLRARLVRKDTLASLAKELDLGAYLHLGPGELRSGGQSRNSILADGLEAVFAAVYLDTDFDGARALVRRLFARRFADLNPAVVAKDPKTLLQEHLQADQLGLPEYSIVEIRGDQHEQTFTVRCSVPTKRLESLGTGASKRKAEQDAAKHLLDVIRNG